MTQLLLDLGARQAPTLDNFVAGANGEVIGRLRSLCDRGSFDAIYLWGDSGCGKSHLLAATAALADRRRPVFAPAGGGDAAPPPGALVVVDDVQSLGDDAQIALFRLFNAARLAGLAMLLAGNQPPGQLRLREDLRTRIGQGLAFEVKGLTDEQRTAALRRHALMRGMRVDDTLVGYLLSRGRRDMPSLMAVLDSLDRASLEQQRPLTLPLLREVMQLQLEAHEGSGAE